MAQIVPKLNLNKTPSLVESNSLIFAKNIRLDVDGTIHRDYGIFPLSIHKNSKLKEVFHKNIFYRIINDIEHIIDSDTDVNESILNYYKTVKSNLIYLSGDTTVINNLLNTVTYKDGTGKIVGIVSASNDFYVFISGTYIQETTRPNNAITFHSVSKSYIIKYDEHTDLFTPCTCNWSYSGGTINGYVVNNLLGETILTIGESVASKSVPLKCINLNKSSINDDETIYTQTPNIPITNLNYAGEFQYSIPNGVYQFFIRYKIRDNFYTDWFPASKELFAGNTNKKDTSFGSVKYVNTHKDSDSSFIFNVEHLFERYTSNYKSFQIGFIISHDDMITARAWKHFKFTDKTINFDYKADDAYEIEIIDLTKPTYQLYDVENITMFKNRLYISNYKETSFNGTENGIKEPNENEEIDVNTPKNCAHKVVIAFKDKQAGFKYGDYDVITTLVGKKSLVSGLTINGVDTTFEGENGIWHKLLTDVDHIGYNYGVKEVLDDIISGQNNIIWADNFGTTKYNIKCQCSGQTLGKAQEEFEKPFTNTNRVKYSNFTYKTEINNIKINSSSANLKTVDDIFATIYNRKIYLNDDAIFVNNSNSEAQTFTIDITRNCEYDYSVYRDSGIEEWEDINFPGNIPTLPEEDNFLTKAINIDRVPINTGNITNSGKWDTHHQYATYNQTITITFEANKKEYIIGDTTAIAGHTTLIPYQRYKFYIHFVKQNGETTNGYYCDGIGAGEKQVPYYEKPKIVYPVFENITLPKGYVACFFSILHTKTNTATCYNLIKVKNQSDNIEASCMDINLGLYPASDNLIGKQGNDIDLGDILIPLANTVEIKSAIDHSGHYYASSDASNIRYFGSGGVLNFTEGVLEADSDDATVEHKNKLAYVTSNYSISEAEEDIELIKCTPYINPIVNTSYNDFINMNLLGYICSIYPLDRYICSIYYTDGSTVYIKRGMINGSSTEDKSQFNMDTVKSYYGDAKLDDGITKRDFIGSLHLYSTNPVLIYSNYNLNYITLSDEPIEKFEKIYEGTQDGNTRTSIGTTTLRLFPSLTLDMVYTLPAMYKSFTRKIYSTYNTKEITRFDNTVRSSVLEGDESDINVFKFEANDYYNIPTNRGTITNLIAIGDAILVHTKDSMFKFNGSNNLQSTEGEIVQTESNVFDTGVIEVFGSDFGFAGLQNKRHAITTESGYIFFDSDTRIVYMYSGNGQIVKISDSIEKLFKHEAIKNVYFANDYYNNRFFMCILFYTLEEEIINGVSKIVEKQYPVTLSFNLLDISKSFVSLHDFYYYYAFNTKRNCYFLSDNNLDISTINKEYFGCYPKLNIDKDKIYPTSAKYRRFIFETTDNTITKLIPEFDSIIDVIVNNEFENIKTLNAINWCSTIIDNEFKTIDSNNITTLKMVEDINTSHPCKAMRIYTDTCISPLNDFTKRSNDYSIETTDSYKYPRFNQGYWTFNYFRNIQNAKGYIKPYVSDENSLIEGKYFVIRFIFNEEFKLETLSINYSNKI